MASSPSFDPTAGAPVRGPSAQTFLKLDWQYPVYEETGEADDGRTVAKRANKALPVEAALAFLAGDDPRPLLVLRECKFCNGTDDALLSRGQIDNEKTFLLARWFHCVKLPVAVLEEDNPFHNLFLPADDAPHMFLVAADGSSRVNMESERSRAELWDSMVTVLKATYEKNPDGSLRTMAKTIDRFDVVDEEIASLEVRVEEILEKDGPRSRKLKKVQDALTKATKEREQLLQDMQEATEKLKLKKVARAKPDGGGSSSGI